ncbi:MAG: hypothetical protein ABIJ26_05575 [Candidatus Margulisiibacteriota bacterium]
MSQQKFSIGEALGFGWNTMKANLGFFILLLIVIGILHIIPNIFQNMDLPGLSVLVNLAFFVLYLVIQMGMIKIVLKLNDGQKPALADLVAPYPLFFRYLFASILYGLIVVCGLILLIVPGIVWAIKFQFFGYFIVDEGAGAVDSLKKSAAITQGAKWDLFLLGICAMMINLLGVLCMAIGLFATIPTTFVAYANAYRKLKGNA